jgi:hypothetical protein
MHNLTRLNLNSVLNPYFHLFDALSLSVSLSFQVEMYFTDDFIFGEELQSFVLGDWKYTKGE